MMLPSRLPGFTVFGLDVEVFGGQDAAQVRPSVGDNKKDAALDGPVPWGLPTASGGKAPAVSR